MKIVKSLIAAALGAVLMAESASALSCMRPDLMRTMEQAKASDTHYYIFIGTFQRQHPAPLRPKPAPGSYEYNHPKPERAMTWFDGRAMGRTARSDARLSRFPVEVQTSCAGPWCGSVPSSGQPVIAFVEIRRGQAPLLTVGPCPEWVFRVNPQEDQVSRLRDCLDKPCKPDPRANPY